MEAEKANAIQRYNLFAAISKTLRILELCVALLLLSWTFTRLPLAVTVSAEYLRTLATFAASPLFVFAVSNVIIAALFAQSGRFSGQHPADSGGAGGLYREFLNNRNAVADRDTPPSTTDVSPPPPPPSSTEVLPPARTTTEAEYQDKEVISETVQDRKESDAGAVSDLSNYRRSQSEKWKGETGKMMRRKQLRRSETEKRRENARENLYPQDKLSNEEFQLAIEAFIAKQMRFLREESSAIVVQNPS